jgi:hypothetical protein
MKYAVLAIALLAATAARANSITDPPGCFTPQAGFSYITSEPFCPVAPIVTPPVTEPVSMPMPIVTSPVISDDQGEDNDDQGENCCAFIQAIDPPAPVGVPEPSSAWLLVLGLGIMALSRREYNRAHE